MCALESIHAPEKNQIIVNIKRLLWVLFVIGVGDNLLKSYYKISNNNKSWVEDKLNKILKKNNNKLKISLLGISYKENTNSIKNAPSIKLIKRFDNLNFKYYDKFVYLNRYKNLIKYNSLNKVISGSDVLIIFNKSDEFKKLNLKLLSKMNKKRIIIDPFGILKELNLNKINVQYFTMGIKNN